jgi:hypothetical protein
VDTAEIVVAIIENVSVTKDVGRIDASQVLGRHVEYVSRADARVRAGRNYCSSWWSLADSPTLFLCVDGVKFRRS